MRRHKRGETLGFVTFAHALRIPHRWPVSVASRRRHNQPLPLFTTNPFPD